MKTQGTTEKAKKWWKNTDFSEIEKITGYKPSDFSPENGYEEFVRAADEWWEEKTDKEKRELYEKYNKN